MNTCEFSITARFALILVLLLAGSSHLCAQPESFDVPADLRSGEPSDPSDSTALIAPAKQKDRQQRVQDPDSFNAKAAFNQSFLFLAIQHSSRMTQAKTRRELGGPFFKEWFQSVRGLSGWKDGGRQFTNYVAHPMQGALSGYLQIQNDPKGLRQDFGLSGEYWKSRMKAMAWSAAWSTQFELGPLSQASIGNVGGGIYEARKMAYVDLVVTPTLGTVWIALEDAVDLHLLQRMERQSKNAFLKFGGRMLLNPMRTCANMLRFRTPWYRDFR